MRSICVALVTASIVGGAAMLSPPARAQESRSFDVPAGPLTDALNRFARQAGVELAYPARLTQGLNSTTVRGSHDVTEALSLLLRPAFEAMGATAVRNEFEEVRQAALRTHLACGFREIRRADGVVTLEITREDYRRNQGLFVM